MTAPDNVSFSLSNIIHPASTEERRSAAAGPDRYWVRNNGEVTRESRLFGIRLPSDRCFVVRAGRPWGRASLVVDTAVPIEGLSWDVPIRLHLAFECPVAEVQRLIVRWTAAHEGGQRPDDALIADVIREFRLATANCDEAALLQMIAVAGGGAVGQAIDEAIRLLWGLSTDVRLTLGNEGGARSVHVTTPARMADVEAECQVSLVVDLRPDIPSRLHALALIHAETEVKAMIADRVQRFYADHVAIDQLIDPARRDEWRHQLEEDLQAFGQPYGCEIRVLHLSETLPPLPGALDEVVRVTLADLALPDEAPLSLTLVARLRLKTPSVLLKVMAAKPGSTAVAALRPAVFGALSGAVRDWSASDRRSLGTGMGRHRSSRQRR